jgi:hypothetical protein
VAAAVDVATQCGTTSAYEHELTINWSKKPFGKGNNHMPLILVIILIVLILAVVPVWPYSNRWGLLSGQRPWRDLADHPASLVVRRDLVTMMTDVVPPVLTGTFRTL